MKFISSGIVFVFLILVNTPTINSYAEDPAPTFSLSFGGEIQFSENDIERYCWETHTITFTEEAMRRFDLRWPSSESFNSKTQPRGFSVKVGGEFVYSGSIPYSLSSFFPKTPVLHWPINPPGWTDVTIRCSSEKDPRFSEKIRVTLLGLGVLEENCSDQPSK